MFFTIKTKSTKCSKFWHNIVGIGKPLTDNDLPKLEIQDFYLQKSAAVVYLLAITTNVVKIYED
jgi:hypothetical protein